MRPLLVMAACGIAALFAIAPLACGDDVNANPVDAAAADGADVVVEASAEAGDAAVVARGSRVLGLAVDLTDLDFPQRVDDAREAGAQITDVTFAWNEIEIPYDAGAPDPDAGDGGAVSTTLFNPGLHIANLVISDRRLSAALSLSVFDVGGSLAPADLSGKALDDPALTARYDALIDYVFDQMHDTQITALFVASGADAWLEGDPQRANAFAAFVAHASAHTKALRPAVRVGFTIDALDGAAKHSAQLAPAWAASDVIGVDYVVPLAAVAAHTPPSVLVPADFVRMAGLGAPKQPILLRQAGYPSAAACGSDEQVQGAFVSETFRAWDQSPDRFLGIVFQELDDATPSQAAAIAARYGRSDAPFVALQQSLGMRASGGREKPAFGVLRREAHARGW